MIRLSAVGRIRSEIFFGSASFVLALYFWFVRRTNLLIVDPREKFHEPIDRNGSIIYALWHGEHFMSPYLYRRGDRISVLVSTHRDGEIVARGSAAEEEAMVVPCELNAVEEFRRIWPFFRDRRIDSYDGITRRWSDE